MAERHERAREHLRQVLLRRRERRRPRPCLLPLLSDVDEITRHAPLRALTVEEMRHLAAFCAVHLSRPQQVSAWLRDASAVRHSVLLVDRLVTEALRNTQIYLGRLYGAEGQAVYRNVVEAARVEAYLPGPQSRGRCFLTRSTQAADLVSVHLPRLGGEPDDEAIFTLDRRFGALLSSLHFAAAFKQGVYDRLWLWAEQHRAVLPDGPEDVPAATFDSVLQHSELLDTQALRLLQWFNESRGLLQWLLAGGRA